MTLRKQTLMSTIKTNIRNRIISGIIVIIPVGVTLFFLRILYNFLSSNVIPFLKLVFHQLPDSILAVISLVVLLLILYGVGLIATHVVGRQVISYGEKILMYIPLVKSIYTTSKQLMETFASTNGQAFKSVVFVEYPRPGLKSLAFVTGTLTTSTGYEYSKVFIPTSPNPTSGFLIFVLTSEIQETGLSLEDGMKAVVSAGILTPEGFHIERLKR